MTCVWCHLNIKLGGCRRTVGTACKNCILLNLHPCKYIYKLFCACMLKKKGLECQKNHKSFSKQFKTQNYAPA